METDTALWMGTPTLCSESIRTNYWKLTLMFYRQTQLITKFFIFMHVLFLVSCQSRVSTNEEIKQVVKKKSFHYIPYSQNNWTIIRQEVTYEDGTFLSSLSSIWFFDENFPVELVTLDDVTPQNATLTTYHEGDKIHLRSVSNLSSCHPNEIKMIAKIVSNFTYTGIQYVTQFPQKKAWFQADNIICVKLGERSK